MRDRNRMTSSVDRERIETIPREEEERRGRWLSSNSRTLTSFVSGKSPPWNFCVRAKHPLASLNTRQSNIIDVMIILPSHTASWINKDWHVGLENARHPMDVRYSAALACLNYR